MICAICREQFKDYIEHIFSPKHSRGVLNNHQIFNEIDKVIVGVDNKSQLNEIYSYVKNINPVRKFEIL